MSLWLQHLVSRSLLRAYVPLAAAFSIEIIVKDIRPSGRSIQLRNVLELLVGEFGVGEESEERSGDNGSKSMSGDQDSRYRNPNNNAYEANGIAASGAASNADVGVSLEEASVELELDIGEAEAHVLEVGIRGEGTVMEVEIGERGESPFELEEGRRVGEEEFDEVIEKSIDVASVVNGALEEEAELGGVLAGVEDGRDEGRVKRHKGRRWI